MPNQKRAAAALAVLTGLAASGTHAQAHEALVISDPSDTTALWITNYYAQARGLPASGFAWFNPRMLGYSDVVEIPQAAMFGHLANKRIERSIDYIILGPTNGYGSSAGGLVTDGCSPVNRFSLTGMYTFSKFADSVLTGSYASTVPQGYFTSLDDPIAFDANETYQSGQPGGSIAHGNLFIAASLGYPGPRGVDAQTMLDMIDRSVAADGSTPGFLDSFLFIETNDANRSGPRDGLFSAAIGRISPTGLNATKISPGPLPPNGIAALGVMTGAANLNLSSTNFTLVHGAFADHLTSFGADFGTQQQTKISEWIQRGAVGSYGTVEEPCNYPQKFPAAWVHSNYAQGLTLGESLLRSTAAIPFQGYFMGDPLCRPHATGPDVSVTGVPSSAWQGALSVQISATSTRTGTGLGMAQALIDGVVVAEGSVGQTLTLPTSHLDDGWHELRAIVVDDSPQQVIGEWVGSFVLANSGHTASMTPSPLAGDRDTVFTFATAVPAGDVDEVRVLHLGRVVAAGDGSTQLATRGEIIGPGPARVWAEIDYTDGTTVVTEPVVLDIANTRAGTGAGGVTPYSYTKRVAPGEAFVVEYPGDFPDALDGVSYSVSGQPAQADALGGSGPYRIYRALPGASGTDTTGFRISDGTTDPLGQVTIEYRPVPVPCLADVNGDGQATPADFNAWIVAYNSGSPLADQNGDGVFGSGVPGGTQDFSAWIINYNAGCQY